MHKSNVPSNFFKVSGHASFKSRTLKGLGRDTQYRVEIHLPHLHICIGMPVMPGQWSVHVNSSCDSHVLHPAEGGDMKQERALRLPQAPKPRSQILVWEEGAFFP